MNVFAFRATAVALLLWASGSFGAGDTPYKPLYEVDLPYQPEATGSVLTDYMSAYHAKTNSEALKRWEKFAANHLGESVRDSMEDVTDMVLLRQASYELARLYYLQGLIEQGDKRLLASEDMVAFTMPSREQGRSWCRAHEYCDIPLPNYLLQPTPKGGAAE